MTVSTASAERSCFSPTTEDILSLNLNDPTMIEQRDGAPLPQTRNRHYRPIFKLTSVAK